MKRYPTIQRQLRDTGVALREVRQHRGLMQRVVARRSGISASMLSLIENGLRTPSPRRLDKLCQVLRVGVTIKLHVTLRLR